MRLLLVFVGLMVWQLGFAQESVCEFSMEGYVFDLETKEPLPFATVQVEGTSIGTVTDEHGFFHIGNLCLEEFNVRISFLGYKTLSHHHDTHHAIPDIYLARDHLVLESILVEAEGVAEMKSTSVSRLSSKELKLLKGGTLGDAVNELSGVTMLATGQNIVKPVIHGLHSNRILIINDGVRHEFQNWGVAHAPEIDLSQIDRIEVVKGAGTVRYGPEALGGVLLIHPIALELNSEVKGQMGISGNSNGRSGDVDLGIRKGYDHWAYSLQASAGKSGDLHAPNYNLTNTGSEEFSYSGGVRWHKNRFDLEGRYSMVDQKLGILRGSVNGNLEDLAAAMTTEPPQETKGFSYQINQPFQDVSHQVFLLKSSLRMGEQLFKARYAFQLNRRQEYDLRKGTTKPTPNIDLDLRTQSFDFDWIHSEWHGWTGMMGTQWQYQDNDNLPGTRTAQFIPNFNNQKIGAFFIESLDLNYFTFESGLRYDYHFMSSRGVFQGNRYSHTLDYHNVTGSLGLVKEWGGVSLIRVNFGTAWRPPNVAELYSFGRHQSVYEYGFWTYESDEFNNAVASSQILSNAEKKIRSEQSFKWIATYERTETDFSYSVTGYLNSIKNYIYTKPAGITQTVRGAFPYFIYDQTDAVFIGFDAEAKVDHNKFLNSKVTSNYVWGRNVSSSEYFVNTPPLDVKYQLNYSPQVDFIDAMELGASVRYVFRQNQTPRVISIDQILDAKESGENLFAEDNSAFDILKAPNGYSLAGVNATFIQNHFEANIQIQNLFNQSYRSYTNRLRYYADEQGRNIRVSLKLKL